MKLYAIVIGWVLLAFASLGAEMKPAPDLKPPSGGDERRVAEIHKIGMRWWLEHRGLLAEETVRVVGSFQAIRGIPRFAEGGDRVWEVRIVHLRGAPTGVLWVSDRNQKVMSLGLPEGERTEPSAASNRR